LYKIAKRIGADFIEKDGRQIGKIKADKIRKTFKIQYE
jgi:hypothetical protein